MEPVCALRDLHMAAASYAVIITIAAPVVTIAVASSIPYESPPWALKRMHAVSTSMIYSLLEWVHGYTICNILFLCSIAFIPAVYEFDFDAIT